MLGLGGAFEKANAQIVLAVSVAPPALPVYVQPEIPGPDYLWTPGYWAWNADFAEYYWVPGAWVLPPRPGVLWTPGYWGWSGGEYVWNAGYWGPTVGFYGGVCYGFGYTGVGYEGGYWSGGSFYYNRSVTNISNTTVINNVYNQPVVNRNVSNVSYNGGHRGIRAQPTPQELQATREQHIAPTQQQEHHIHLASTNRDLRASANNGKPRIAAVGRAGDFSPHNVVAAKSAGGALKPASLTTGKGLNGAHPGNRNLVGPGNPAADRNLAAKPYGAAGAPHHDASHGANKNAIANLNAGPADKHRSLGSNAAHMNGLPPRANGAPHLNGLPAHASGAAPHMYGGPARANGAPAHMNGAPPYNAAMMKMPGGPAPHAQAHPNMPRPAHMQPPAGPRPGGQPHPAAPQKKDPHHN
jgi:hypothetical protein